MLLLCQIRRESRLLSALSFLLKHRSTAVPLLRPWPVSLLHSKATITLEKKGISVYHSKVEITEACPESSSAKVPNKRGIQFRSATDELFMTTAEKSFGTKFDAFIEEYLPTCGILDIANFVRIAGKKLRHKAALHMMRHLPAIAEKLELQSKYAWKFKEISFIIYGMQSYTESNDGYLGIMMTMSKIATRTLLRNEVIDSQNLSMMLYGLKGNKFNEKESKEMLGCLHKIAEKCTEPLSAQAVGNALYGLQGMSSDDENVRLLLRSLSVQVERCTEPLSAQAVGNAVYGLQGMSSDDEDVRLLLRALSPQVERCTEPLSAQAVGNAIYGLQRMSSDNEDVQPLLRALSAQVDRCRESLDAQAIGNSLIGLQAMNSDNADVRLLLRALSAQVERCTEPLSPQSVGIALFGLHCMDVHDEDVQSLRSALAAQLERHREPFAVTR